MDTSGRRTPAGARLSSPDPLGRPEAALLRQNPTRKTSCGFQEDQSKKFPRRNSWTKNPASPWAAAGARIRRRPNMNLSLYPTMYLS